MGVKFEADFLSSHYSTFTCADYEVLVWARENLDNKDEIWSFKSLNTNKGEK